MRQAGRVLPEYRKLREEVSDFWQLCSDTENIVTITQQPLCALDIDAAILFSDILVPLACYRDISVRFADKSKPQIFTHKTWQELAQSTPDVPVKSVPFVYEAIKELRSILRVPLIAFSGTPWTTALYIQHVDNPLSVMQTAEQVLKQPDDFGDFLNHLSDFLATYLIAQRQAGAQQLMLFDSWASLCPPHLWQQWLVQPVRRIIQKVKDFDADCPIIYYGRGVLPELLLDLKDRVDVFALSSDVDIGRLQQNYPGTLFQGNIPPELLLRPQKDIYQGVCSWFDTLKEPVVVNLGAGLLPTTPLENIQYCLDLIRQLSTKAPENECN
jgi:uroporphyrinogen decarboxylase